MTTNSNLTGYTQIVNGSPLYINGAVISTDPTTPDTKFNVSSGIMRDQSNTLDLDLGNYLVTDTVTVVNPAVVGLNGIDVGTQQASKAYYVYVIADTSGANPTGVVMSLAAPAVGPVMPYQYNAYRHIGFVHTGNTNVFIWANWFGTGNARKLFYYAPAQTTVSAGNATSFTPFSLATLIPPIQTSATFLAVLTPSAASRAADLTIFGGANPQLSVSGQVTSVPIAGQGDVTVLLNSGAPTISYRVSNSADAVSIKLVSYDFWV